MVTEQDYKGELEAIRSESLKCEEEMKLLERKVSRLDHASFEEIPELKKDLFSQVSIFASRVLGNMDRTSNMRTVMEEANDYFARYEQMLQMCNNLRETIESK